MKPSRLLLTTALSILLAVVLSAGGILALNLSRMLPRHDGITYVSGLQNAVEIVRDARGIPHIYASSADDLFFAQGYVHAQDRWWQMEFQRHTAFGSIQELTGTNAGALASDLFIRTWGWNRAALAEAPQLLPETQSVLEAYSSGVNAYIGGKAGSDLALEYTLLGLTGIHPEIAPWEPIHTTGWAKVMAYFLSGNMREEIDRVTLLEQFDPDMVEALLPEFQFDRRPTILTAEDLPLAADSLAALPAVLPEGIDYAALNPATTMAGRHDALDALLPLDADIGSNNWVISGSNTATGQPILANDPHLGIQMPSIWYEIGLHCRPVSDTCPYDVVGFSFVGTPAVITGHNQRIAWGVTNVGPDVQDLYIIRVNPDNPYQYEYNGEWRDMDIVTETIAAGGGYADREDDPATAVCEGIRDLPVNDAGELEITVRLTHFGPIVTDNSLSDDCRFIGLTEGQDPLALRWTALEPGNLFQSVLDLNKAANWSEFREALTNWQWPAQNFVYADVDGNIGYQTPGSIPIRAADHSGLVPVPGWTDAYEWQGYIPFDLLPRILNPERGWIVTANNAVVPEAYYAALADELGDDANYMLERTWDPGYRAERIVEMVSTTRTHTLDTVAAIQGDNHSLVAEAILPHLLHVSFDDSTLSDAVIWLAGWNLQTHMDSPQAALWETFYLTLSNHLWADQLGEPANQPLAVELLLENPEHPWWDDVTTADIVETRDDILAQAFSEAYATMTERFGPDRAGWRWGDLHTASFVSTPLGLSGIGLVETLVNRTGVPVSGSSYVVNNTAWGFGEDAYQVRSLPSYRMIIDLSDLDNSLAMHTTGQSGHPFSPNYDDMIEDWRHIRYQPLRYTDESVQEAAASRLVLRPSPLTGSEE